VVIRNVGPVKSLDIELGDLTIFIGPPNTGKSITAKSVYALLLPLDKHARSAVLRYLEKNVSEALLKIVDIVSEYSALLVSMSILFSAMHKYFTDDIILIIKEILLRICKDHRLEVSEQHIKISCVLETDMLSISHDFLEYYTEFLKMITPISESSDIKVDNISIISLEDYIKISLVHIFPAEITLTIPKTLARYLTESLRKELLLTFRKALDLSNIFLKILENTILNIRIEDPYKITLECISEKAPISLTEDVYRYLFNMVRGLRNIATYTKRERTIPTWRHKDRTVLRILTYLAGDFNIKLLPQLQEKICEKILENMVQILQNETKFRNLIFVPYCRQLISNIFSPLYPLYRVEDLEDILNILSGPLHISFLRHATDGITVLEKISKESSENKYVNDLLTILRSIIIGSVKVRQGKIFYEDYRGVEVPISKASALVVDTLSLLLPLLPYVPDEDRSTLAIIEEPESQVHPYGQVLLGIFLALLSAYGTRLIVTTHSGLLVYILYVLKSMNIDHLSLCDIVRRLYEVLKVPYTIEELSPIFSTLLNNIRDMKLKVYLFNYDGIPREVEIEKLGETIPTITDIPSLVMDWVIDIIMKKRSE